ncbi:hypothetical protein ACFL5J_00130 [Thermodesulfobacteriota bacterium]
MDHDAVQKQKIRRWSHCVGIALVVASLAFIGHELWCNSDELRGVRFNRERLGWIWLSPISYGMAMMCIIMAWCQALHLFGEKRIKHREAFIIYARSQIVKYLPGNVFHLAGRHYLGKKRGLEHGALMGAAVYEIIGLIFCGVLVTVVTMKPGKLNHALMDNWISIPVLFLLVVGVVYSGRMLIAATRKQHELMQKLPTQNIVIKITGTIFLYAFFFCMAGISLAALLFCQGVPIDMQQARYIFAAFAASWVAGFVTPGAPAGVGVREAVAMAMLGDVFSTPVAMIATLLFRVNTLGVDLILFASGLLVGRNYDSKVIVKSVMNRRNHK